VVLHKKQRKTKKAAGGIKWKRKKDCSRKFLIKLTEKCRKNPNVHVPAHAMNQKRKSDLNVAGIGELVHLHLNGPRKRLEICWVLKFFYLRHY